MCLEKIYYNTYADGAKDVTKKFYPCRESRAHQPDVHKYDRNLPYSSKSRDAIPSSPSSPRVLRSSHHFLGDLPTPPRRSKSPSPANRRDSVTYIPGSGLADLLKPATYHGHHDRLPTRRSTRHHHHAVPPSPPEPPVPPKLKRSVTSPHLVVIEQDQSRLSKHGVPLGPIHVADDPRPRRRNSAKAYVVQEDDRERRREKRDQKRRLSTHTTSPFPEVSGASGAKIYVPEPPRLGLRRSNTTVPASVGSNASGSSTQHKSKRLRFEDEVRRARDRQNAEIAKRASPPEVHQEPPLKGILKPATTSFKGKGRAEPPPQPQPQSQEREELDLYDKDRLLARFTSGDEGSESARDRHSRRSKVWVTGDRYQYQ